MAEFSEWITGKYLEWRGDKIGREGTVSAFARYVGVDQSIMSYWMSGRNTPDSAKSINMLVSRFGGEVYDVLDITPAVNVEEEDIKTLQQLAEILRKIPREKHNGLIFAVRAWAATEGITIDDSNE